MGLLTSYVSTDRIRNLILSSRGHGVARLFAYPADPYLLIELASVWDVEVYALAIDNAHANTLRTNLPSAHVVCAALSDARISHGSMSIAVVELPQPDETTDSWDLDNDTAPVSVLRRAALTLVPDGLVVAAIPPAAFTQKLWRALVTWFKVLEIERLVHQGNTVGVVVVGKLQSSFASTRIPAFPDLEKMATNSLPAGIASLPVAPKDKVTFIATGLTWDQAVAEGRQHGAWVDPAMVARLAPEVAWTVRPLMPLARGHLGQLIACGAFNNALLKGPDGPVLLKGQTHKIRTEVEKDKNLTTMRDAFQTTVTLLHLKTGRLEILDTNDDHVNSNS